MLVDDLLPLSPDEVVVKVFLALNLFPANIEGALGKFFHLGDQCPEDFPAPLLLLFQHAMDDRVSFRYFHRYNLRYVVENVKAYLGCGISGGVNGGISGGIAEGINRVADYIKNTPGRNVTEITAVLDIPQRTVERWLKKLKEQGEIVFIGLRKTGGYHVT